jgi:DNA adenine methylase
MSLRNSFTITLPEKYAVISAHPFVKWVGGKRQLLPIILNNLPDGLENTITKYAEPFVGGGAVLFELLKKYEFEEVYINDMNVGLISCYKSIQNDLPELSDKLIEIEFEYYSCDTLEKKSEYYYNLRDRYNGLLYSRNFVDLASCFIALNKTCFNGMYRVNSSGLFNVPFGKHNTPTIYDEGNLIILSELLSNTTINCGDYKDCVNFIDEYSFAYFDPPYRPLTSTAAFTSYTKGGFDDRAQTQLADFVNYLSEVGAKIMLSNSDPKNINEYDDFFDNIYSWANIQRIAATRMINCKASGRGKVSEILVTNYGDLK